MKLFFALFVTLLLSACQSTSSQRVEPIEVLEEVTVKEQIIFEEEEGLTHLVEEVNKSGEPVVPTDYENLWLKLAEGFNFEVPDNKRVAQQRNYYLNHPTYLKKVSKRAEPFLFLIIEQIEANNLPLELALLPIVESTFNPFAYSSAGASGLWQFMPASADRFGLHQNWWYDGRRDVYASTGAALKYMTFLHRYLGDNWLYAFAAYNSGEGRVKRSIAKNKKQNKPVSYWDLSLPKETKAYVPKLLALIDILRNHEKYDVELPFIPNKKVLTYVDVDSQIDLAYAGELAGLTVAEIQLLNPAFNHWATSPNGPHKLLLPTVVTESFTEKLSKVDKSKRIRWDRYTIKSGDSLSLIAKNYQTTTSVLKQINDLDSTLIRVGKPLLIPIASQSQQQYLYSQAKRFERQEAKQSSGKNKIEYKIVEGDTLWDISRRYKVTSKQIAKWNGFQTKKTLRLGQVLTIWKTPVSVDSTARHVTYYVRSGDSLGRIAYRFNVKTADLVRWNNLQHVKYIKPGQKINVYINVKKTRS